MLTALRIIAFFLIGIPLILVVGFTNKLLNLGITENDMQIFITPTLSLLYLFMVFPQLRKGLSKQFIKTKKLDRLIAIPIVLAIIKLILVYLYVYIPLIIVDKEIPIGKDQYVSHKELSNIGEILLVGVIGPLNEEILFRYLLLFFLPYAFLFYTFIKKPLGTKSVKVNALPKPFLYFEKVCKSLYFRVFYFQDKKWIGIWVVVISSLFSLTHGPDLYSFPIYFLPGVLYSYLYLRYGLLASWVAHGFGNVLSPIVNQIFISILLS